MVDAITQILEIKSTLNSLVETSLECLKHGYIQNRMGEFDRSPEMFLNWVCPGCIAEEYIDIVESPCGFVE